MSVPNFENRTLYHGDNLDILQGMNSETIDLGIVSQSEHRSHQRG